jgi:hypothetical protein
MALQKLGAAELVLEERGEEDGVPITRVRGDGLARKIKDLVERPDELELMGKRAQALGVEHALALHLELIEEAASRPSRLKKTLVSETIGYLEDDKGTRTELAFPRNSVGRGLFSDLKLGASARGSRALVVRNRADSGVQFQVIPQRGVVMVNGEVIHRTTDLESDVALRVGKQQFVLRTESVERTRVEGAGGIGSRVLVTGLGTLVSRGSGFVRSAVMFQNISR